jgi:hypothetical protein
MADACSSRLMRAHIQATAGSRGTRMQKNDDRSSHSDATDKTRSLAAETEMCFASWPCTVSRFAFVTLFVFSGIGLLCTVATQSCLVTEMTPTGWFDKDSTMQKSISVLSLVLVSEVTRHRTRPSRTSDLSSPGPPAVPSESLDFGTVTFAENEQIHCSSSM